MKKFLRYFLVLTLVLSAGVFTSCEKDKAEDEVFEAGSIVGTWKQTNDAGTKITLTFNKDTSGTLHFQYPNGDSSTERFSYDYRQGDRYLEILETSCRLCGYYDVSVSKTRLELYGVCIYEEDDVYYVFTR